MQLKKSAIAGTLESSDVQIMIEPSQNGIELFLTSSVMNLYGKQIKSTILTTLANLGVENARLTVVDKGAVDCTIKARVECAVFRAAEIKENLPWGVNM
ncbi:citrate lyase subunit gamma (acyl carrier protein) [Anaerospora hongkongensis]|uniref:Citrate lyase acyl carrier protein n=1 Tax=Anaerospora hongkongensis TaxID=244830 RepID=A0A4R1Q3U7_9FIRM|nr:citrate lyase acyl carrier protein [Anaerospora hongkongensis]TCL39495.1 citrate lyase subunit gamma (acyl carrier protein) [Anaerospora hongkongensis]